MPQSADLHLTRHVLIPSVRFGRDRGTAGDLGNGLDCCTSEFLASCRIDVEADHFVASGENVTRHGRAHNAESNNPHWIFISHFD